MRLIFWQRSLSPHQLPYIVRLINNDVVDYVAIVINETTTKERLDMGWDVNYFEGIEKCNIFTNPNLSQINELLSFRPNDSWHFFSGIRAFPFVFKVFKLSLNYKIQRALITERPNTFAFGLPNGKPLWLHWLRWKIMEHKYISKIQCVFAMGSDAVSFFRSISKKWNVYEFGYCTQAIFEIEDKKVLKDENCRSVKIIYVGGLYWWKSVNTLLFAINQLSKKDKSIYLDLTVVGDGPEKIKLEKYVVKNKINHIRFLGKQKQSYIPALLAQHDILVLPSIYDGWGAVVNEALQNGLYVVCSDRCGAKSLLDNIKCGRIFKGGSVKNLADILLFIERNRDTVVSLKSWRKEWAQEAISGDSIANYMIECLCNKNKNITLPWKK